LSEVRALCVQIRGERAAEQIRKQVRATAVKLEKEQRVLNEQLDADKFIKEYKKPPAIADPTSLIDLPFDILTKVISKAIGERSMLHSGTVIARKLCHFTGVSREFRLAALGNLHKISDPSARTDGLQTFFESPMKLKAYEIQSVARLLELSTVGKKALLIHRIMKHLHVSAIPSTPDHPSAIVTVIREKHMPLPREMRSMLSPIFRFLNSFCGMSQWSVLGAGAYVNKLKLFEREFGTYEAMQIHVDSVISIGQQELYDREEAQRQRLARRGVRRLGAYTLCAWRFGCRHVLTTCADHAV
jgi:hypothetical protein